MADKKEQSNAWMSVPAFGDWDLKNGLPDYSLDFSKIRETRKQNKRDISRASLGNEDDLVPSQHQQSQSQDHHHRPRTPSVDHPRPPHLHHPDNSPTFSDPSSARAEEQDQLKPKWETRLRRLDAGLAQPATARINLHKVDLPTGRKKFMSYFTCCIGA